MNPCKSASRFSLNFGVRHVISAALLAVMVTVLAAAPVTRGKNLARPGGNSGTFSQLLERLPAVKNRVCWLSPTGGKLPYDRWTPQMKQRIEDFYQKLARGERNLGMHLPEIANVDPHSGRAYFTADQAFDVYAAHVAHVFYVENARLVPWSIANRPGPELDVLVDGERYFAAIKHSQNTQYPAKIKPGRDFQEAPENDATGELNGDPRIGYDFITGKTSMSRQTMVGKDELDTLANLTIWIRDNCGHGALENGIEQAKTQRWLQDRLHKRSGQPIAIVAEGCHSASKLLVDLARSINISLLHVRAQEDNKTDAHFFNRTHGGLLYGWGGREPLALWHTDSIYADSGEPCFPLDQQTGALASPERAKLLYFENRWVSPKILKKAGFVYKLERVFPFKGFGVSASREYEDRADFGWMIGYWKSQGSSKLAYLYRLEQDYTLCGEMILTYTCKRILAAQLGSNIESYKGSLSPAELPPITPLKDIEARAAAWFKAVGNCERFNEMMAAWSKNRGRNLMK